MISSYDDRTRPTANNAAPLSLPTRGLGIGFVISVIVPTLNEESTIDAICSNLVCCSKDLEIIIADGGSSDNTIAIAKRFSHTRVVCSRRRRGAQMNAGAHQAGGDILVMASSSNRLSIPPWFSYIILASQHLGSNVSTVMIEK
ncbi:MAG: glycosyltransferase [Desulfobacterales bacterium]|nr:MAG: glycosyltransferase [Desulfobacterales bacterium]